MSAKKVKAARKEARASAPPVKHRGGSASFWTPARGTLVAAAIVAVMAASFVLPGVFKNEKTSAGAEHAMNMGAGLGQGLPVGAAVPRFSEQDLLTRKPITSQTVYARKTLLFFSEGVMCQACFEQIQGLEKFGAKLRQRGIQLVSITPDTPSDLQQAVSQYAITTPMISDEDRNMSEAFNTLGKGMHSDTPGHSFALIDRGKVLWYRDYWLPPDRVMYVDPQKLLADIPA